MQCFFQNVDEDCKRFQPRKRKCTMRNATIGEADNF